jgi:hypothetical protein
VLIAAALMAARALGLPAGVGPTALLAFVPAVLIAQVIPISISGLGVREGLFALFLHPLGVPPLPGRGPRACSSTCSTWWSACWVHPAFAVGQRSATAT